MKKDRLEMFSDGVIAIIITLMVLEIKLPAFTSDNVHDVIRHVGVYALSFIVIGILWLNHNAMFEQLEKVNASIVWLNFLLLFFMSLIPLPTEALGLDFFSSQSHVFYGVVMTLNAAAYSTLQLVVNKNLTHIPEKNRRDVNKLNWICTALYAISIPLSLISIYIPTGIFILIPAIYFIPSKKLSPNRL
ncbi:MAG TPA: TMEM175 family protein [Ignavibacteria bacterium]|nr:TMEM175 family protein [Ignavibacteria bacterium]